MLEPSGMNILLRRRKLGNGSTRGIQAASKTGLVPLRNDNPFPEGLTYVFRWGCTSEVPPGVTTVNTATSIRWCADKRRGRVEMQAAGVSVPTTWGHYSEVPDNIGVVVFRPATHAQGRNLWTADTGIAGWRDVLDMRALSFPQHYVSVLVNKVAEYRVAVIQNRVAWVAQKTPGNPDDVAWNVARGGRFTNVRWKDWPMAVVQEALKAAKVSGTDFCGVDVMVDGEGKAFVLEVNSAPSQTSAYRQTCFAKCFDYIVTNGKEPLPDPAKLTKYSHALHPALKQE